MPLLWQGRIEVIADAVDPPCIRILNDRRVSDNTVVPEPTTDTMTPEDELAIQRALAVAVSLIGGITTEPVVCRNTVFPDVIPPTA